MKNLFLVLLFSLPALAQEGFRNDNGNLIWEHTYPAGTNVAAIIDSQSKLEVAGYINDIYTGTANEVKNNCGKGSPLMRNNFRFDFEIRKNNGNYVVTVSNLQIIEKFGPTQSRIIANRCEKYFVDAALKVKKDKRTQTDIDCLNTFLSSIFSSDQTVGSGTSTPN